MPGRSTARFLVWLAFAAQAAFFVSWVVAGALEPRYSHLTQAISELAARNASRPGIVTAGIAMLGLSLAALAAALAFVLPRRQALPVGLFAAPGLTTVLEAVFPLDCGATVDRHCRALARAGELSLQHYTHAWLGFATQILLVVTPFALARTLWPGTAAANALACGAAGVAIGVLQTIAYAVPGSAAGLIQRAGLVVLLVWVLIVGVGVLWATRPRRRASALIPMRPREFLARRWTGDGELVLRPLFLGRLLAQRVDARRESTWISETVWRIDDEADFGGGRLERRRMFCEFLADDHVRLTADDLPDGAEVWLEREGFRLPEFRMAWPIGPLPVIVRCVDRSHFEDDGTFVNRIDVYSPGPRIPVARVTFRMRSSEAAPREERSGQQLEPA